MTQMKTGDIMIKTRYNMQDFARIFYFSMMAMIECYS